MKFKDLKENEAVKLLSDCEKLRDKYGADGLKIYFRDKEDATIKVISEEHVIRTIRIGAHSNFDAKVTKNDN